MASVDRLAPPHMEAWAGVRWRRIIAAARRGYGDAAGVGDALSGPSFWDAALAELGLRFYRGATAEGGGWAGAKLNAAALALDTQVALGRGDRLAVSSPAGEISYSSLKEATAALAHALRRLRVRQGETVALALPPSPELVVGLLACASIGAIAAPLPIALGARALATRLRWTEAVAVLAFDGVGSGQGAIELKERVDAALRDLPQVQHVIVHRAIGREIPWAHGRDHLWSTLTEEGGPIDPLRLDPETPLLVQPGRDGGGDPVLLIHQHGGLPLKAALDLAAALDLEAGQTVLFAAPDDWELWPWAIWGTLLCGATLVLGSSPASPPDRIVWCSGAGGKDGIRPTARSGGFVAGSAWGKPARAGRSSPSPVQLLTAAEVGGLLAIARSQESREGYRVFPGPGLALKRRSPEGEAGAGGNVRLGLIEPSVGGALRIPVDELSSGPKAGDLGLEVAIAEDGSWRLPPVAATVSTFPIVSVAEIRDYLGAHPLVAEVEVESRPGAAVVCRVILNDPRSDLGLAEEVLQRGLDQSLGAEARAVSLLVLPARE